MLDFYSFTTNMPTREKLRLAELLGVFPSLTLDEFKKRIDSCPLEAQEEIHSICNSQIKFEKRIYLKYKKKELLQVMILSLLVSSIYYIFFR